VDSAIYEENADPSFSNEGGYFPLVKSPQSLVYSTIPLHDEGIIPIVEVMLGMDYVEVDDAILKLGGNMRSKDVINVKSVRTLSSKKTSYAVDGGDPLYVIYLGV